MKGSLRKRKMYKVKKEYENIENPPFSKLSQEVIENLDEFTKNYFYEKV